MAPSECNENWVDVFVTKAANDPTTKPKAVYNAGTKRYEAVSGVGGEYGYDDKFCCTVQSIEIDPLAPERAYITENESAWILPTWTTEYELAPASSSAYSDIEVGDLVRVGGVHTSGYTDYLTVVEKRAFTELSNASSSTVRLTKGSTAVTLPAPTSTSTSSPRALATAGIAHIGLRLNRSLNCTKLEGPLRRSVTEVVHRQTALDAATRQATLENRHEAYQYLTSPASAYDSETVASEQFYYPLYVAKKWAHKTTLNARLDYGLKQVSCVKLMGYSLVNKRQIGIHHAHEMLTDDYIILRIKEIEGHVISNNKHCDGAFAVLPTGTTSNNVIGAAEVSRYEPAGLFTARVSNSHDVIRNLTIEVTDRNGDPAHFGRFHLWFKLLVRPT